MSETQAAVAFVERASDGKILCVWNKRYGGWGMPGGKVEIGEIPAMAALRELAEETGLVTNWSPERIWEAKHETKPIEGVTGRGSLVRVYRVWVDGEPRQMEDGCPVTWLSREEFLQWSPFADFYRKMFAAIPLPCCEYCDRNHRGIVHAQKERAVGGRPMAEESQEAEVSIAVRLFTAAILHGDEQHRAWLTAACEAFIAGDLVRPPPPVTTDALLILPGLTNAVLARVAAALRRSAASYAEMTWRGALNTIAFELERDDLGKPPPLSGGGPGVDEELQRRQCVVEPQSGGTSEPGK